LDRGIVENMPFVRLPEPTHATPKNRALNEAEVYQFWYGILNINSRSTRAILKLMLLLGRRGTEVVAATWDQVDLEAGIWHMMPAKIRQHHRATTVALDIPLPPLALQIFKERRAVQSMWEHVFPSEYNSLKSQSVHSVSQAVHRHMEVMGFANSWTPHDLRRTTATHLGRLNYDQEQIDRIMGHKIQGVAGIYNRHSYVNQRLDALTKWDSEVQRIISGPAPVQSK
jgi:integrase